MIPVSNLNFSGKEKKLLQQFRKLNEQQQKTLQEFAEFLASREEDSEEAPPEISEPVVIPRPKEESVVKAIKRLTATYPMLEKQKVLNQTSSLMAQHIMQGRAAVDVIDELEIIFKTHYEKLKSADD
ncbi:MAG TPA: Crp/Fnr family transcriptional regulator [Chromatiales bacterium]|nr:Crp/Fnr family transcriptional regulator [Thiotrichales bacterium]HIP68196.1 Crp/Fnr family transcriptional regulator [Chromatiales bacterium]